MGGRRLPGRWIPSAYGSTSIDGADFSGWAAQPARRTVAGVLVEALGVLFGKDTELGLTVAGRTDAGVHATGQVCHVNLPAGRYAELAGFAAAPARRADAAGRPGARRDPGAGHLDARFSATFRRYEYRVTDTAWGPEPLRRHDTLGWVRPLDLDRLNTAAAGLEGEHDFAAFCKRKEHATTVRAVNRLDWRREPDGVVRGDRAGGRVLPGDGAQPGRGDAHGRRRPPRSGWPANLLTLRERSSEVTVAPAHGLTLVAVGYPEAAE